VSREPAGEDRLVAWLRRRLAPPDLLGDDVALLPDPPAGARWVATVDSQIGGVHHPRDLDPALAARRLLAVNLSDLAAAGADPAYGLLALAAPVRYDHRRFLAAFTAAAAEHRLVLAGGDLARHPERTVATLTLLGLLPPGRGPLPRAAGRPGDALWLGGTIGASAAGRLLLARGARVTLGGGGEGQPEPGESEGAESPAGPPPEDESALPRGGRPPRRPDPGAEPTAPQAAPGPESTGLLIELPPSFPPGLADPARRALRRHLLPVPQLALGRALSALAGRGVPVAAIDLSDGLALDLSRLCRASGTGAEIAADRLPVAAPTPVLAVWLGEDPHDLALHGGEDYVLLFTLPADEAPPAGFLCTRLGRLTDDPALTLLTADGPRPLEPAGWDHLAP
jgi:thiamine-monophosphate kinase